MILSHSWTSPLLLATIINICFLNFNNSFSNAAFFMEEPEIKIEKFISTASEEVYENNGVWDTELEYVPQDSLQIMDRGETIIVSPEIEALGIVCNASYPVQWTFHQAEYADDVSFDIVMKTSRESNDISNPTHDRYIARLELYGDMPLVGGNYTCHGVGHVSLERSVYIFWQGSSPPYLVLSGRTIHVYPENNMTLVLPCYVSKPNVEVQLYQEVTIGKFKHIQENYFISFDYQKGFTINLRKVPKSINVFGRFKCVVQTDDDEVHILVEKELKKPFHYPNYMRSGTGIYHDRRRQQIVCCTKQGDPPSLHSVYCMNPGNCKMKEHRLRRAGNNGKKIVNGSCIAEEIFERDHGILRCKGEGIDVFRSFTTDFGLRQNLPLGVSEFLNVDFDWKSIIPDRMMYLQIQTSPPYYHKQLIAVTCEGMNSFFSDGHKWTMRWRNRSLTNFQPIEYIDDVHIHGTRKVDVILTTEMLELSCYLPVWNSTVWVRKSVTLNVQDSIKPSIEGSVSEEVVFYFNETEQLLECKSSAKPTPDIYWKKDGFVVPQRMVIFKGNGASVLIFHRVKEDTPGTYTCVASNVAGETSKIFTVYVKGIGGSSAWGTTAAVLVPLLIIALIATAGVLIWKMQLQKKIVNHLQRIVFRDAQRQHEEYQT